MLRLLGNPSMKNCYRVLQIKTREAGVFAKPVRRETIEQSGVYVKNSSPSVKINPTDNRTLALTSPHFEKLAELIDHGDNLAEQIAVPPVFVTDLIKIIGVGEDLFALLPQLTNDQAIKPLAIKFADSYLKLARLVLSRYRAVYFDSALSDYIANKEPESISDKEASFVLSNAFDQAFSGAADLQIKAACLYLADLFRGVDHFTRKLIISDLAI